MADPRYVFRQLVYEAVTPIHVGAGQDVGIVDLPVVRERTSDHPYLPGSGIRGALRDRCEAADREDLVRRLFGPEGEAETAAGCVSVFDAHLVLFPVRASPGVFLWLTCPFVLERWRRLAGSFCGGDAGPAPPDGEPAACTFAGGPGHDVMLEEYPFSTAPLDWSWPEGRLGVPRADVVLVGDADFLHFVRHATLVRQRNRLSTAKTVVDGQLFSIEAVPARAVFVGFVGATRERTEGEGLDAAEAMRALRGLVLEDGETSTHVVLGGEESVGWGVTRLEWPAEPAGSGPASALADAAAKGETP